MIPRSAGWMFPTLLLAAMVAGCGTGPPPGKFAQLPDVVPTASRQYGTNTVFSQLEASTGEVLRVGDALLITFPFTMPVNPIDLKVREDGSITLLENQTFVAAGKTITALEKEIHDHYVPAYFKRMTVTVKFREASQFYYVGGEVRLPSRQAYLGRLTVLGAIASCGGFTDFARRSKVKLTRVNGRTMTVDCKRAVDDPGQDPEIYSGDKIYVPRTPL